jgi:hypothetical protein
MYATGYIHNSTSDDYVNGQFMTLMSLGSIEKYKDHYVVKSASGKYFILYDKDIF